MSERKNRFSRLGRPKRDNGDLFEHFGVPLDPPADSATPLPAVQVVHACPACGWYTRPGLPCEHCGEGGDPA